MRVNFFTSILALYIATALGYLLAGLAPSEVKYWEGFLAILGMVAASALIRIGYAVYDAGRRSADKEEK